MDSVRAISKPRTGEGERKVRGPGDIKRKNSVRDKNAFTSSRPLLPTPEAPADVLTDSSSAFTLYCYFPPRSRPALTLRAYSAIATRKVISSDNGT